MFLTLQSIEGQSFPDFVMLDARIASSLRRITSNPFFRRRVSVEGQRHQQYNRFLREANCLHDLWTLSINLELMIQLKVYRICSIFAYRMTTSMISKQDGIRSYSEQVKCLRKRS